MGGVATFTGTIYQQRVIAYLLVHLLGQRRLKWFEAEDDTPESLSAETGGAGDDCLVIFRGGERAIEVQAKHGLTAGAELKETIATILSKLRKSDSKLRVVIAVDASTSRPVLTVGQDLDRLRSGRTEPLTEETRTLFDLANDAQELLLRVSIVSVDVDADTSPHSEVAIARLESILADPSSAVTAWRLLVDDAGTLCARRLSRLARDIIGRLEAHQIRVRPAAVDENLLLDFCRDLLRDWYTLAARDRLANIETAASLSGRTEAGFQYRLLVLKAQCEMQLGHLDAATALGTKALDLQPAGIDALRVAGFSRLRAGDFSSAMTFSARAVAAGPHDSKAWALKLQVDAKAGKEVTSPPILVARSTSYRSVEATVARNRQDWAAVLEITAELLEGGNRDIDVLLVRAEALAEYAQPPAHDDLRKGIALCDEIQERIRNNDDPRLQNALRLRSGMLAASGEKERADADLARLRDISGGDPDVLQNAANIQWQAGDLEAAVRALEHPVVESDPRLLAYRAQLKFERADLSGARADAEIAASKLQPGASVDAKLAVGEALLLVGETQGSRSLLSDPTVAASSHPGRFLLAGRVAFSERRVGEAIESYRAGAERNRPYRLQMLLELADNLRREGHHDKAVDVVHEVEQEKLTDREFLVVVRCLYGAGRLVEAQRAIDERVASGSIPAEALSLALQIAVSSENTGAAIQYLTSLIGRGHSDPGARVELAQLLFDSGHPDDARQQCLAVLQEPVLPPITRARVAFLLATIDGSNVALDAAFRSYREGRQDYRTHQTLIMVSGLMKTEPVLPEVVEPDTYVLLRRDAEVREYTIFSSGPIDPTRGELTVDEARSIGLLGKRKGVEISLAGPVGPVEWVVTDILTAVHHGIQETYENYEKSFPDRPFIRRMSEKDHGPVDELSQLVGLVEARKRRENDILEAYAKNCLPLGFVANVLGTSLPAIASRLQVRDDLPGQFVEFGSTQNQLTAVQAARESTTLVLTRSALVTLDLIDLREIVASQYSLVLPRTLESVLRAEARDAAQLVETGRATMGSGDTGLVFQELKPGDPLLLAHRDRLNDWIAWLSRHATVESRPLEAVESAAAADNAGLRDKVGHDSWDAVELTHHLKAALLADDLGLRRLEYGGAKVRSLSTGALITRLSEDGLLDISAATYVSSRTSSRATCIHFSVGTPPRGGSRSLSGAWPSGLVANCRRPLLFVHSQRGRRSCGTGAQEGVLGLYRIDTPKFFGEDRAGCDETTLADDVDCSTG